jgi:hypothetical protein
MRYALPLLSVGNVDDVNALFFPLPTHVNIVLPEAWVIIEGADMPPDLIVRQSHPVKPIHG